jgi:hypothetical protein
MVCSQLFVTHVVWCVVWCVGWGGVGWGGVGWGGVGWGGVGWGGVGWGGVGWVVVSRICELPCVSKGVLQCSACVPCVSVCTCLISTEDLNGKVCRIVVYLQATAAF